MWIDAASKYAPQLDQLFFFNNLLMIIPFILVNTVMVFFVIKYRRRGDNDITSKVAHNTTIEVIWTIVPTVLMMVLFVMGLNAFRVMRNAPKDSMEISVVARQWNWEFHYPAGLRASKGDRTRIKANTLYLEANRDAKLIMKSTDVIHSFFVPEFRTKEDVVPGMYTYVYFNPLITARQKALKTSDRLAKDPCRILQEENTKLPDGAKLGLKSCGAYRVYCTEYCGKDHSAMLNWAVVLEPADFKKKIAQLDKVSGGKASADLGAGIFKSKCTACHTNDGSKKLGPSFKGLFGKKRQLAKGAPVTADENYIRESIESPMKKIVKGYPPVMTPQGLSEMEIESMILYIKSLK